MGSENKLVDLSYLEQLSGGNTGYIAQVVSIFLEHTGKDLVALNKSAKKEKNPDEIYRKAHKLKSGLGVVRIEGMLEDVIRIESLLKGEDRSEIPELAARLLQTFRAAEPELREIVNNAGEIL